MVYDTARTLAEELRASEEYKSYQGAKELAMGNDTTKQLVAEYHRLQIRAQAAAVQGKQDAETMEKLKKIGELLQFDRDASAFLIAEFRVNKLLADVYKILAEAIDVDLSALEA